MVFGRWRLHAVLLLSCSCGVFAQYSQGQFFTPGLAIIGSPQPNSQGHAGSTLSIAITVGGSQGQLKDFAPGASSSSGTGYDNLELFLISSSSNINITVASNILTQQQGSNVKHVDYDIPTCVTSGSYNLTLYETSRFNNDAIFVITQVPISIENNKPSGQTCGGNQLVLQQPQADVPLSGSPWLGTPNKLDSGLATLASTNNVLIASNPQIQPPAPDAVQPQATVEPSNPDPAISSSSGGTTTTSHFSTAVFETQTSTKVETQQTPVAQPGGPNVVFQTLTVTSNVFVATVGPNMNNGGAGILFPISGTYRTIEYPVRCSTALFLTYLIFVLLT